MEYIIKTTKVSGIDNSGLSFYANVDTPFDAHDYCEHAGINYRDVDFASIQAANDAASQAGPDGWVLISHEQI